MSEMDRIVMGKRLLQGGMPFWHVTRMLRELKDHCDDIQAEALSAGLSPEAARLEAAQRLGSTSDLADACLSRPELTSWIGRLPVMQAYGERVLAGDMVLNSATVRWAFAGSLGVAGTFLFLLFLHLALFGLR